jgi:exosortase/archaeosortase family protein
MVPWTEHVFDQASRWFQLFSARLGASLLQFMGFSVFRDGTHIELPHMALEVAPACSGLGFLYAMMALSIPLVYLTQRSWWRAAGILAFGVTIPILANATRVAFVGSLGSHYGLLNTQGPLHAFQGWFVAQIGIAIFFLANWAVAKLPCGKAKLSERWKIDGVDFVSANGPSRVAASSVLLMLPILGFGYTYGWFLAQAAVLLLFFIHWAVARHGQDGPRPGTLLQRRSTIRPCRREQERRLSCSSCRSSLSAATLILSHLLDPFRHAAPWPICLVPSRDGRRTTPSGSLERSTFLARQKRSVERIAPLKVGRSFSMWATLRFNV